MNKKYTNLSLKNIYKSKSLKSEVTSQIIYGENFLILKKFSKWLKIKTLNDNYIGFIINRKYLNIQKPSKKIFVLKSKVYEKFNGKFRAKKNLFLSFSSRIQVKDKYQNYLLINNNMWVKSDTTKDLKHNMNFIKVLKLFLNCKYKWGGKTFDGIDCSALIQIYYQYNNLFFPRDTSKQINYKKNIKRNNSYKKGDIIFWKGHVAVCINSKKLIHAYGPKKKVLIMPIEKTINLIEKTANLKVKKICRI